MSINRVFGAGQGIRSRDREAAQREVYPERGLQERLAAAAKENEELLQQNRALQKKKLLESADDSIPEDVERMDGDTLPFEERLLVGHSFANRYEQQQRKLRQLEGQRQAELFVANNPEYFACQENFEALVSFMVVNSLAPTVSNFQIAYDKLSAAGLLITAPEQPIASTEVQQGGFTQEQIDRMTAEEYRTRVLRDTTRSRRW
jgi:hypothetical protein